MFKTTYDKEAKLWSGRDVLPLYNTKISVAQVILGALTTYGPKIAQISDNNGIQMSFDDIRTKTIRAAQNLQNRGYAQKQVFGFIGGNSHHVAPIVFASFAIGCPVTALDPSFGKTELVHMLNISNPVLLFCDLACYDLLQECLKELKNDAKIFTFGGSKGNSEQVENLFAETHEENRFMPVRVDGDNETAMIMCSSGTTGLSKGVCLSHAALLDVIVRFNICNTNDVMLCFSSLYWLTGVIILLRGTLYGAARVITTDVFSTELQLRLIEQYRVTFTVNAPHQIILLMKNVNFSKTNLSTLKYVVVGGSKVPLHVKGEMSYKLPSGNVYVSYGISEIGVSTLDYPEPSSKDTVGRLLDGICAKVIDEDGNRCGPNVDGEICLKARYKFIGYYGNKQATDELFDKEGFISSGDIGHFDEDGNLYIVDRKKDLFKYNYFPISPSEMDAYLIESPLIKAACVVGIPGEGTDLPAAAVVRADGSNITEKDVFDLIAGHFADFYKLRGGVYFVNSLPTTPSGKVLRRKVKEIAMELYNARNLILTDLKST